MPFPFNFKFPHTAYHARQENSEYPYSDYHIIDLDFIVDQIKQLWEYVAEHIVEFPLTILKGGTGANNAADARENLGLGEVATLDKVTISKGGTNATTAAGARTNLGLGAVATENIVPVSKGGTGANNAADARVNLGIEETTVSFPITLEKGGTGVAAQNLAEVYAALKTGGLDGAALTTVTNLNSANTPGTYIYGSNTTNAPSTRAGFLIVFKQGSNVHQIAIDSARVYYCRYYSLQWFAWGSFLTDATVIAITSGGTGATSAANARTNLGLGPVATESVVPVTKGGTGATSAANARSALGLGAVAVEDVLPISKGGTGASTTAGARQNLGIPFGGMATELRTVAYGGDSGIELRVYGSDNTIYALVVYINAIALNVSYDGGATWVNKWSK